MKSLLIKIGVGVSLGVNLFIFAALLYNLKMYDKRVDENRKFIKDTKEDSPTPRGSITLLCMRSIFANSGSDSSSSIIQYSPAVPAPTTATFILLNRAYTL